LTAFGICGQGTWSGYGGESREFKEAENGKTLASCLDWKRGGSAEQEVKEFPENSRSAAAN
jgi:hypothetical protein